ncbi:MAG TPA: winged helix-turn-helix domain-containing protein [Candidatus Acidoferrales bacterium]|jgi:TolB-like protein/DNA-binding winged helix-turn-helix (wHTH) protein/Flp pilus assembly protein TadD|nr:winged helix-turn-helix domain-containing protein [Candidatus Acidoferrales bacterium]
MSTSNPLRAIFRFGAYEVDSRTGELRKNGMRIRCQEQPIQVLVALLERPGELLTREELRQRVWPEDTFVDFDHALNTAVKKIRSALNDEADSPRYLETVPRRGYRFIAPVQTEMTPGRTSEDIPADSLEVPETHRPLISRRAVLLAAVLIAVVGGGYYWSNHRARASGNNAPNRTMLAVLPFENMTNDPSQEYFSDGMTEETISQLGRLNSQNLGVIARTSAMKYKHSGKGAREIGRELNSDYLLEGSIRREGSRVRVVAQLIRVADQSPRWSHQFDYEFGEPLYIETDAATEIANMVHTALEPAALRRVQKADTTDFYLRGLAESNVHTAEGLDRIFHAFDEGMKKDPDCAPPYAALARIYERGANLGLLKPTDAYAKARAAAEKAIEIDPSNPEAHIYLADALLTINYDWARAQAEIQKALTLNVNDPTAHEWNGIFLALQGRLDQSIVELRTAVELDPLNAEYLVTLGDILMEAGRPVEAETQLNAAIGLDPASDVAHASLAAVYEWNKRYDEAINETTTTFFLRGQRDQALNIKAAYQKSGYEAARQMALRERLAYLLNQREKRFVSAFEIAVQYAKLGDKQQSLKWLQTAYEQRDVALPCLRQSQNKLFASVKDAPEFQAILRDLHYPQ